VKREDIEKILRDAGWTRTVSAPSDVVDYQRSQDLWKKPPIKYNRVILYPEDVKRIDEQALRELMEETNLALHAEIILRARERAEKVEIPTEVPEGVTLVRFELYANPDAESTETVFDAIMSGEYEFRSTVNLGAMVRTVMVKKVRKEAGTPIQIVTTSKDMAWSLMQTIDWTYKGIIEVIAVRREGLVVEVAYIKKGLKPPPPKEKLIYHFKKTDGWTLVGEPKPPRPPP